MYIWAIVLVSIPFRLSIFSPTYCTVQYLNLHRITPSYFCIFVCALYNAHYFQVFTFMLIDESSVFSKYTLHAFRRVALKEAMSAPEADHPTVVWRRQSFCPGREVAVMAAGGPFEDSDTADHMKEPPAVSAAVRSNGADCGRERKTSFIAAAKVVKITSALQCQLSTEDFRAPTPRPLPPSQLSESPMFQWKLSSPPPRRSISPLPTAYNNHHHRPGSPALRQGVEPCS